MISRRTRSIPSAYQVPYSRPKAMFIGNSTAVLKQTLGVFVTLFKGPKYNKAAYVELLGGSARRRSPAGRRPPRDSC